MKVKQYLRVRERKTFMDKSELAVLRSFSGLNCRGGARHLGVPQRVVEFAKQFDWTANMWQLGDVTYEDLKHETSKFWSDCAELKPEQIKIGYGSMQVLERINKVFIERGAKVLGYAPQFIEYVTEVIMSGADYEAAPLDPQENFRFSTHNILAAIKPDHCLIYIDNPNNPTGQLISLSDIEEIVREAKGKEAVVLVDEAYGDYAEKENSAINLLNKYENLIVTRTFTKGYQFAGIRVGYGIFPPELGDYYDKIDVPLPIPAVGSYLAKEALLDQEFIPDLRQRVKSTKDKLVEGLKERGYLIAETLKACPIFVLGHRNKGIDLKEYLLTKGILTLSGTDFMNLGKNYVRVTIPARAEDFLARLSE